MLLPFARALSLSTIACLATLTAADLNGVNLGTHVSGPKITAADLSGKVVMFEYWGVNCPPCVANIPHVSELASLADSEQLMVIANHCQGPGKTAQVWKEKGGTDKPSVIEGGSLTGANVTGIPRCFIFDHTGKQVFDGHPSDVTPVLLNKLLDAAPGPLVNGGPYKFCAADAAALKSAGKPVTGVLKSLRSKAEKGKPEVQTEARALLDGVKAYCDKQMAGIASDRTENPAAAAQRLQRISFLTKGDEFGKPFEELQKELKADKVFQDEVKAAEALIAIKAQASKLGLDRGQVPASRRSEAQAIGQAIEQVCKRFPSTKAAKEAAECRDTWSRL